MSPAPSSYAFIGWKTKHGSTSSHRTSSARPSRGSTPSRGLCSGSQMYGRDEGDVATSGLKTTGRSYSSTYDEVSEKSCIIGRPSTGMSTVRRTRPSVPTTTYCTYGYAQQYATACSSPLTGSSVVCAAKPPGSVPWKSYGPRVSRSPSSSYGSAPPSTVAR